MKAKCEHDCFHCKYDDCVVNTTTVEERKEIKERDMRYFNAIDSKAIIKQKATRARRRQIIGI